MAKTRKVNKLPTTVDDLRAILDPGGYQRAASEGIAQMKTQLASLFFNLDMARETPEMTAEQRLEAIENLESLIRDAAWRIKRGEEIVAAANKPPPSETPKGDPADNGA